VSKAEPTNAQFAEKMLAMAAEAMREGRINDAATNFRQATKAEPRNAPAWLGLAWSLSQLDQPNDALAAFREAITIRPDWAEAHLGMGGHLLSMRRTDDAVTALERAVTLAPNMSRARFTLALAHLEKGDRAGAVRQYQVLRDMDAEMAAKLRASIYPDDAATPAK
jgi:Flp pilus assembly protein TadD